MSTNRSRAIWRPASSGKCSRRKKAPETAGRLPLQARQGRRRCRRVRLHGARERQAPDSGHAQGGLGGNPARQARGPPPKAYARPVRPPGHRRAQGAAKVRVQGQRMVACPAPQACPGKVRRRDRMQDVRRQQHEMRLAIRPPRTPRPGKAPPRSAQRPGGRRAGRRPRVQGGGTSRRSSTRRFPCRARVR